MYPPPVRIGFILPVLWFLLQLPATAATTHFPSYDVIRPNVAFWIKIYTEYATDQGIVHDSDNLNLIYDVIDLQPYDSPSASKINRMRMKRVKAKYERIFSLGLFLAQDLLGADSPDNIKKYLNNDSKIKSSNKK